MHKGRMEAFSDGVLAIVITVMVLEIKAPIGPEWGAIQRSLPAIADYAMSFSYIAIYWNNHHHMLQSVQRVNGAVLWANMHLLFWLSLVPVATQWLSTAGVETAPVATYGFLLIMAAVAYYILTLTLVKVHGQNSAIARALGSDFKGKISIVVYAVGIGFAFFAPAVSCVLFVAVAVMWFVPDPRFERQPQEEHAS